MSFELEENDLDDCLICGFTATLDFTEAEIDEEGNVVSVKARKICVSCQKAYDRGFQEATMEGLL